MYNTYHARMGISGASQLQNGERTREGNFWSQSIVERYGKFWGHLTMNSIMTIMFNCAHYF